MRRLKKTAAFFVSAGKRTTAVTEKLRLHQRLRNRTAIHRNKGMRAPLAMAMQVTRRKFLTATGLSDNRDCRLAVRNPHNLFAQCAHRGRLANQAKRGYRRGGC